MTVQPLIMAVYPPYIKVMSLSSWVF